MVRFRSVIFRQNGHVSQLLVFATIETKFTSCFLQNGSFKNHLMTLVVVDKIKNPSNHVFEQKVQ